VGNLLKKKMQENADYVLAMEQYLVMHPVKLKQVGNRCPKREELHER
jgi:hypothetical protein